MGYLYSVKKLDKQSLSDEIIKLINNTLSNNRLDIEDIIDANNSLGADLGFGSIDLVRLLVNIQEKYQKNFDFQNFFIKNGNVVRDVTIADLVDFIYEKLLNNK
jgi:acyl carrier protein